MNLILQPWIAIYGVALLTLFGILFRPFRVPEAVWACLGACAVVLLGRFGSEAALRSILDGVDVYLFLAGMMILSELARREGVFVWLADWATGLAKGSATKLFFAVYVVGIAVTALFSNDATVIVLTPAVIAATQKANQPPLPYLFACAFISNAASFILPISNPANLVVYGSHLPPLMPWLKRFGLPSVVAIGFTYVLLALVFRKDLQAGSSAGSDQEKLGTTGKLAFISLIGAAIAMICASFFGWPLGIPTCVAGFGALALVSCVDRRALLAVPKAVSWSVLPLVAGLFVIVGALESVGAIDLIRGRLAIVNQLSPVFASVLTGSLTGIISNLVNNLPLGLIGAHAINSEPFSQTLKSAFLVGVDLGPNFSVTGSLATILWLFVLRREGFQVTAWSFLKVGLVVTPLALLGALAALGWSGGT